MANLFSAKAMLAALGALAVVAGAAASADAQSRRERGERRPLPSKGEPGLVVAADIAFAKAVREDGMAAALAEHAASGAVVHTPVARFPAAEIAADDMPRTLDPNAVWTSCDGSVAVSFGRYRSVDGTVGSYANVWQLQGDSEYKWSYRMAKADDPQPVKPPLTSIEDPDNTIVVPGLGVIEGQVADCRRPGYIPDLRAAMTGDSIGEAGDFARDGTLYWRWSSSTDGSRRIRVWLLRGGTWEEALDFGTGRWGDLR